MVSPMNAIERKFSLARCRFTLEDRAATGRWTLCGAMFAMQSYSRIMREPAWSERGCANHAMGVIVGNSIRLVSAVELGDVLG
jgi:hypothetical protein